MSRILLVLLLLASQNAPGKTEESECGRPQRPQSRIVGGSDALEGDWPWQVGLYWWGMFLCGGSLISEYWVLTAAHCVVLNSTVEPPEAYKVSLGTHHEMPGSIRNVKNVSEILIHEDFSRLTLLADIALMRLSEPANFSDLVQPVCLPQATHHFPHGASCWATGWGTPTEKKVTLRPPRTLQQVELKIFGEKACQCLFDHSPIEHNLTLDLDYGMMCAGSLGGGKDTCQGDSGGPLVCKEGDQWFLAGITSFGFGCGRRNKLGVFTAVTNYESWIRERVTGHKVAFPPQLEPLLPDLPEYSFGNCTPALPECGRAQQPGLWPWKAMVVSPRFKPCHGVLVSENWVLVPASCFQGLDLNKMDFEAVLPPKAMRVPVTQIVLHVNSTKDYDYDLALLELGVPVKKNETRPVCLPMEDHYFVPGSQCHLAQWGPGEPPPVADSLLESELMSNWWCHCLHNQKGEVVPKPRKNPLILCPQYRLEEDTDRCWMGSRWSLLCQESGYWFLAAVSVPPENCLRPQIFSPLQPHEFWIRNITINANMEEQLNWNWEPEKSRLGETELIENLIRNTCPFISTPRVCGLRQMDVDSWPWMAEVHGTRGGICMGILVSPRWILAASHCVTRQAYAESSLRVYLGRAGSKSTAQGFQVSRLVRNIQLPSIVGSGAPLILLELDTRVEPSPIALPVCLHAKPALPGTNCLVLGWKDNRVPLAVEVYILPPGLCHCFYQGELPYGTICVKYSEKTEDRFQVDSTPALMCQEQGTWVLLGLALKGSRKLFAPVGPLESWISHTVGEASFLEQASFSHGSDFTPQSDWDRCPPGLSPPTLSGASTPSKAALLLLFLLFLLLGV
ncbi:polyserase-2 [Gracilinanus agilis]|uniref:polyserase-2 n=1 Tax=Gracilinanus agilis TaxID=191870 RepID=UPI001CFECF40|nr:polyserase-2 [Gracilinanus agilis]